MSLNKHEIHNLVDLMHSESMHIAIACDDEVHASKVLAKLQNLGYKVFIQSSAISNYEAIITGVENGNIGPSWSSSRRSEKVDRS